MSFAEQDYQVFSKVWPSSSSMLHHLPANHHHHHQWMSFGEQAY
jgi:hypothetical protein